MLLSTGSHRNARRSFLPNPHVHAKQFRRIAAPLLGVATALRSAILAFGQGHVGPGRELTPRQVADIAAQLGGPLDRCPPDSTRILYVGDLSPESGALDLLSCIIAWADRHQDVPVDIRWAGTGDLQGVLRAQARPPNLTQSFAPPPAADALAGLFAQCGILAAPTAGRVDLLLMAQAMAAGLPVLGSARCPETRLLVSSRETGWLFDPLSPAELSAALDAALSTPPVQLADMRLAGRRRVSALCHGRLGTPGDAFLRHRPSHLAATGQV